MRNKVGVLLVNLGTPDHPDSKHVRSFLQEFLSDPRVVPLPQWLWQPLLRSVILPLRAPRVAKLYQSIWWPEGSPLRAITHDQCEALSHLLTQTMGYSIPVVAGMTYGKPSVTTGLLKLRALECNAVIVLPLFPQYSSSTTAAVFDSIAKALKPCPVLPQLRFVPSYYHHPDYINALVESIETHWRKQGKKRHLFFSFHGLPQSLVDKGDPYPYQCEATVKAVVTRLQLTDEEWTLAYQSRVGYKPWLKPYTDETLIKLANQGCDAIDIISPGFAADCLETLEELAKTNRHLFLTAGGKEFNYIPALNVRYSHIACLAALVKKQIEGM